MTRGEKKRDLIMTIIQDLSLSALSTTQRLILVRKGLKKLTYKELCALDCLLTKF